jgi:hypothetical protein
MPKKNEQIRFVVTANRLDSGRVVYLDVDRAWTPRFEAAALIVEPTERDELTAWAIREQKRSVTGCYAFEVALDGAGRRALSTRERIRAAGEIGARQRMGHAA